MQRVLEFLNRKTSRMWFAGLAGLAILLTCGLSFSLPYAEPDLWGHVQFGRDALHHGMPRTTTYSFTADGYTWINHENLSEWFFAQTVDRFGVWFLLWAKCFLGIAIVATIGWRARRNGASWLVAGSASLLFAATVGSYWQVRPQITSFAFFTLLLLLLDMVFNGWDQQWHLPWIKQDARFDRFRVCQLEKSQLHWLWLAAPLFALWANSHGGFVAGYCFFVAYLAGRGWELWQQRREQAWEVLGMMGVMALVAGLSTLATPYGIDLHRWLLSSLNSPRPEITEWHALSLSSEAFLPFAILAALSAVSLMYSRRSLDATHLILLSLTVWQAMRHQRHVPFAALAMCYWLPVHWNSLLSRFYETDDSEPAPRRWLFLGVIGVNIALFVLLVPRLTWLRVDRSHYPVSAIQYMSDHQIEGRMVVTYNWAQYVIGALGEPGLRSFATASDRSDPTGIQVAFDGRFRTCYPQAIVDQHFDFVLGPQPQTGRFRTSDADPYQVLCTGNPDLVLISRQQVPSTQVMQQQTDWILLYQDQLAQLWGRSEKFGNPEHDRFIPGAQRIAGDQPQVGYVAWPALPQSNDSSNATQTVAVFDQNET